jgi:hypothetical protein
VGEANRVLNELVEDHGCAALLLHHTNKAGTGNNGYQLRGSSALGAAPEAILTIREDAMAGGRRQGRIEFESKDTDASTIYWEFEPSMSLLLSRTPEGHVARPESIAKVVRELQSDGFEVTSDAMRTRWTASTGKAAGKSAFANWIKDAREAGKIVAAGRGRTTTYGLPGSAPRATRQLVADLGQEDAVDE